MPRFSGPNASPASSAARLLRSFALLTAGSLVVHHLRYLLSRVHGGDGPQHAYLSVVQSIVAVLLVTAVAAAVVDVRTRRSSQRYTPRSFQYLTVRSSLALIAIYVLQETLECVFEGEPVSLAQILVHDRGWFAIVAALVIGAVIALLEHSADRLVEAAVAIRHAGTSTRERRARRHAPATRCRRLLPLNDAPSRAPPLPA
ncbi:MAG TPA: hypothetical protein VFA56_03165 [Gaiellaceae bacterium]|nr:hypothetical protein [Gaiellaceae bacterium]